jgi:cell division topological specificity factor
MLKKSSVSIAKERLKNLVTTDRESCMPESFDMIYRELYNVLSKYIEITKDDFQVEINRTHILIHFTGDNL